MPWKLLSRKALIQEIAYSFRELVHHHHVREHGGRRQAGWQGAGEVAKNYVLIQRREKYSETLGLGWAFESLKAHSW